ncbi:hypothetical protein PR048_013781 [Dryococelus australis]|uniref:Uncharacterized protein n=1 Tax=Dryococelus australis TaxID=614101 RepID=A0ABQ9HT48_9NEOP|nr:hypothetical protein PR048_013781 [Dryococelus australis]
MYEYDGFSVGIVLDDAAGSVGFLGISYFPRPLIPVLLHTHLASPSSAVETALLRFTQIFSLTSLMSRAIQPLGSTLRSYVFSSFLLQFIVVRLLASHQDHPCSISGGVAPGMFVCENPDGVCIWLAGILRYLPFHPPFHSGAALYSTRITLAGSQDLFVKTHPNLSTSRRQIMFGRSNTPSQRNATDNRRKTASWREDLLGRGMEVVMHTGRGFSSPHFFNEPSRVEGFGRLSTTRGETLPPGAVVADRVTPGFSHVGIVPDDAAGRRVSRGSPVSPAPSFRCAPFPPRFTFIDIQDLNVESSSNIFTSLRNNQIETAWRIILYGRTSSLIGCASLGICRLSNWQPRATKNPLLSGLSAGNQVPTTLIGERLRDTLRASNAVSLTCGCSSRYNRAKTCIVAISELTPPLLPSPKQLFPPDKKKITYFLVGFYVRSLNATDTQQKACSPESMNDPESISTGTDACASAGFRSARFLFVDMLHNEGSLWPVVYAARNVPGFIRAHSEGESPQVTVHWYGKGTYSCVVDGREAVFTRAESRIPRRRWHCGSHMSARIAKCESSVSLATEFSTEGCSRHFNVPGSVGAPVAEQLACPPTTKAILVQSPAGSLMIFACGNRARQCLWSTDFLGDLPFPTGWAAGWLVYHRALVGKRRFYMLLACDPILLACAAGVLCASTLTAFLPIELFTIKLLASHQGELGSIPGRFTRDFRKWESCRTMPLVGGFSRGSPVSCRCAALFSTKSNRTRQPISSWKLTCQHAVQHNKYTPDHFVVYLRDRLGVIKVCTSHNLEQQHSLRVSYRQGKPLVTEPHPTKANRVQPRPGHRIFASGNLVGRCRSSPGFLGDLPFPPLLHSGAAPYSLQSLSSALKTSLLRAAQISSLSLAVFCCTDQI